MPAFPKLFCINCSFSFDHFFFQAFFNAAKRFFGGYGGGGTFCLVAYFRLPFLFGGIFSGGGDFFLGFFSHGHISRDIFARDIFLGDFYLRLSSREHVSAGLFS